MDLNTVGSWASIISLPLSAWTLYQAYTIKSFVRERALDDIVKAQFAQLRRLPIQNHQGLTTTARQDINHLLQNVEDFYLSRFFLFDAAPKKIVVRIKGNLGQTPDLAQLKLNLAALESLIFTTNRS